MGLFSKDKTEQPTPTECGNVAAMANECAKTLIEVGAILDDNELMLSLLDDHIDLIHWLNKLPDKQVITSGVLFKLNNNGELMPLKKVS